MKCKNCKWWDDEYDKETPDLGICRKNAPRTSNVFDDEKNHFVYSLWPETIEDDWCGAFQSKSVKVSEILKKPIEYLELSPRAENALVIDFGSRRPAIRTIGELVAFDEKQLLIRKNFGKASIREVKRKLFDLGLYLRGGEFEPKHGNRPSEPREGGY